MIKKILIFIIPAFLLAPFVALADVTSTIVLPDSFISNIWGNVNSLFTGINGYITLIIGVILAAVVLEIIIGAIKK